MRDFKERVHGPYRRGNKWRIIVVTSPDDRCVESFESESEATARISSFERDIATRTIGASVEAYLAAQERRVTEGEIRPSTIERDRYHLRSMLKLSENSGLELRRLTPAFGERLYEARTGAVDTHRNGLNVVRAFGAWCVKQGWLRANPFESVKGRGRRKRGKPQLRIEEARVFQTPRSGINRDVRHFRDRGPGTGDRGYCSRFLPAVHLRIDNQFDNLPLKIWPQNCRPGELLLLPSSVSRLNQTGDRGFARLPSPVPRLPS